MNSERPSPEPIQRAQGGARAAFNDLVARHKGRLESFIRHELGVRLRTKLDVEDLLQETFLEAFQSIRQFRGRTEETFRSWLRTIARHVIQNQVRFLGAKKRALPGEVSLADRIHGEDGRSEELVAILEGTRTSPSKVMRREERFDRLKEALGSLSADHKQVIRLSWVQGLPMKEIAVRMGRTEKAASVLLWRAMKKLKDAFGNTGSFHLPHRSLEAEGSRDGK